MSSQPLSPASTAGFGPFVGLFLLLGAASLAFPAHSQAGLGDCLRGWLVRIGAASAQPSLTPSEVALWRRVFTGEVRDGQRLDPVIPYVSIARLSEEDTLFWHAYHKLPLEIRERLSAAPPDYEKAKHFFAHLRQDMGGERTFLDLVQRRWEDQFLGAPKVQSYAQWERQGLELLEKAKAADPSFVAQTEGRLRHLSDLENAGRFWITSGVQPLPLIKTARGFEIQLGKRSFPVKKTSDGWVAQVPRELLAHRFDNPVSTERVIGMAKGGVKPPSVYRIDPGLDGRLYISDGNHRFQLDPRKTVKVRFSDPPQTVSLPVMLDFLGHPHPPREAILRYRKGEIGLEELLGHDQRLLERLKLLPLKNTP